MFFNVFDDKGKLTYWGRKVARTDRLMSDLITMDAGATAYNNLSSNKRAAYRALAKYWKGSAGDLLSRVS